MFDKIKEDIDAVRERDPAAPSVVGVVLNYPGLQAVWAHRVEHWLWNHGLRGLARFSSQFTRFVTGVEIHPAAVLGRRVFIDHGMGVVVGETAVVGNDVTIYQGATLGGTGKETGKRHPTVKDGAIIGVGSAVLGNITVGARAKVGGGAVVVDDVPDDCTVVGIPGHLVSCSGKRIETVNVSELRRHEELPDPIVDSIERLQRRIDLLERRLGCPAVPLAEEVLSEAQSDAAKNSGGHTGPADDVSAVAEVSQANPSVHEAGFDARRTIDSE